MIIKKHPPAVTFNISVDNIVKHKMQIRASFKIRFVFARYRDQAEWLLGTGSVHISFHSLTFNCLLFLLHDIVTRRQWTSGTLFDFNGQAKAKSISKAEGTILKR